MGHESDTVSKVNLGASKSSEKQALRDFEEDMETLALPVTYVRDFCLFLF